MNTFSTPSNKNKKITPSAIGAKKTKLSEDVILEKMEKAYDVLTKKPQQKEKDECEIFGQLIAKRLQQMEQNGRDFVMHEIENIMYHAKLRFNHHKTLPATHLHNNVLQGWNFNNASGPSSDCSGVSTPTSSASRYSQVPPSPYSPCQNQPSLLSTVNNDDNSNARSFFENFQ